MNDMSGRARALDVIARFAAHESIQAAVWIGAGGLALAVANLIFAGILSPEDYGKFSVVVALLSVGAGISPMGLDQVAARLELQDDPRAYVLAAAAAVVPGVILALVSYWSFRFGPVLTVGVGIACVGAAVNRLGAGFERGALRIARSQFIIQLPYGLLLVGSLVLWRSGRTEWTSSSLMACGAFVAAAAFAVLGRTCRRDHGDSRRFLRGGALGRQALVFLGIATSGYLLLQLERFVIPKALSLQALGTYGVVATVVGSPYRLLSAGIGYALLPRLRATDDHDAVLEVIGSEARLAVLLVGLGALVLIPMGSLGVRWLYRGKYDASLPLVSAVVLLGSVRTAYGLAKGAVGGLGTRRELTVFNLCCWCGLILAGTAGVALSFMGLPGVVLGVSSGWILATGAGFVIAGRLLREREPASVV